VSGRVREYIVEVLVWVRASDEADAERYVQARLGELALGSRAVEAVRISGVRDAGEPDEVQP
jgi:hypothetical protein